jgi:hypothetical protein
MPARQSFVVDMVEDRQHLGSAIALNSSMFNAARLVGPSIAGVVIGLLGEGYCFLIDGLSYIAVIISLLAMRLPRIPKPAERQRIWGELRDGWSYVSGFAPIRSVLLLLAVSGFVGMPYTILMPVMASTVLGGGPMTLGLLMAASGVGAVIGVLQLAFRRSVVGLGRVIAFNATAFGVALIAFALSHRLWISLLLMVVTGFGVVQQMAASNTFLRRQARTCDELLHHGADGHGALWKPVCRGACQPHRRSRNPDIQWNPLRYRRRDVRRPTARAAGTGAAYLYRAGDHPLGGPGTAKRHRPAHPTRRVKAACGLLNGRLPGLAGHCGKQVEVPPCLPYVARNLLA